jgi:putative ABC transport system substrate-binding protein
MTGVTNLSAELSGKRAELLKAAAPHMTRCAAIANQGHPGWQVESDATQAAAKRLKLELVWLPVYAPADFAAAFDAVARSGAQGLIAVPDNLMVNQAQAIADFSLKQGIPAISGLGEFTDAGNLMSYGPVQRDVYVKLGAYADKLLRGAKASELPVENPTRFELVFNLKVAQALKLKIPQPLLLRADRVIE